MSTRPQVLWYTCDYHIFCPPTFHISSLLHISTLYYSDFSSLRRNLFSIGVCFPYGGGDGGGMMCECVCKGGWQRCSYITLLPLFYQCSAGEGRGTYLWAFHATVIPSNLIQPSSFSLVCFSHIGACRLQKPCVCVCARVRACVCGIRKRKGDRGRQTELMSSECVCICKYLCVK